MKLYEVTLIYGAEEIIIEVEATSKEGARYEAKKVYPNCHIVHIVDTLFRS